MQTSRLLVAMVLGCALALAVGLSLGGREAVAAYPALPPGAGRDWRAAVERPFSADGGARSLADGPPDWTATGEGVDHYFGLSVATAGDVNGDGYSDVVVGAYGYYSGRGRAYVYAGGPDGLSATPVLTLSGEALGTTFGISVAPAGDVNGDGYGDVVVGAAGYDGGRGGTYVYAGGPGGLSPMPVFTATGEGTGDYFGRAVATAGDMNGDGYADVVVGAWGYNSEQGRAYVYAGGSGGLLAVPILIVTGEAISDCFGMSVATAGDVNGDGYADLVVGAEGYNGYQGRAYVYAGAPGTLVATPVFTVTGGAAWDRVGHAVASAGDTNGDGYADLLVGAVGYDSHQGRAYVYSGGPGGLSPTPIFTATGEGTGDAFGVSVAPAGDVDGDGYADVAVGASYYNSEQGRAYVYAGGAGGLAATPVFTASGEGAGDYFGAPVATAGDVNGDGYSDLVVGAWGYGGNQGRAYVYVGVGSSLAETAILNASGDPAADRFGYSVATAGDVNGDGYADVVVGALGYNIDQGWLYVYAGGPDGLSVAPIFSAAGESAAFEFGHSVATAGDVNGDGYVDVVVGAWGYPWGEGWGRAYVYAGGPGGLAATPVFTASGEGIYNAFGWSVATAGDVNGDGFSDVVVGAPYYNSYQGRTYVYAGGPGGLAATPIFTATGEGEDDYFGHSVATVGDVNGDGYADVIIGANRYNGYQGRAYVYAGGPDGLSAAPIFTATGEGIYNRLGSSVATAGDVNGDGHADVVVGASGYNQHQGRAYVYAGGAGGLSAAPIFTATGESVENSFGLSVASAGDVDGDGYADVVVGAYEYNGGQGRAYVYAGGPGGVSATPVFTPSGEGVFNVFGYSVATAGDVNGDGFSDIVVGAPYYNSYQGRAYVYAGGGGDGRLVLARQALGDGSGRPVQPWGLSPVSFEAGVNATSPLGRTGVRLQVEACPPGAGFGTESCSLHTAPVWTDVTTASAGIPLSMTLTMPTDSALVRWRARVVYDSPFVIHGPWRRYLGQALEADVRLEPYCLFLPLVLR